MNEIELKISIDEANLILESLGHMPFNKVYNLIAKMQDQAAQQLKPDGNIAAEITKLDTKNKSSAEA